MQPVQSQQQQQQHIPSTHPTQGLQPPAVPSEHVNMPSESPPIPQRNNIRNRLELDSVSPAVQRPNPMDAPVSPITPNSPSNRDRANFSYPSRAPPQGVPRQVPAQLQPGQHPSSQQQPTPQQWGEAWNSQQHVGYDNEAGRPVPFRVGHSPSQPQSHQAQKQPTMANLKAAAHGIHVRWAASTPRTSFANSYAYREQEKPFEAPSIALSTEDSLLKTPRYMRRTRPRLTQAALKSRRRTLPTDLDRCHPLQMPRLCRLFLENNHTQARPSLAPKLKVVVVEEEAN